MPTLGWTANLLDLFIAFFFLKIDPKLNNDNAYKVANLETDGSDSMNLCLHERDFYIGKTIADNIVASLEESRACIVVLTKAYTKSRW